MTQETKPLLWRLRNWVAVRNPLETVHEAADEIEALRAALKVAQQSLLEFTHAQECGPSWYSRGESGMYAQVRLWMRRGAEAINAALGPYDDNGEFEKEKITNGE